MSRARPIVPGRTYLITRRTRGRAFLLCPNHAVRDFLLYALAVYADYYGIKVMAWTHCDAQGTGGEELARETAHAILGPGQSQVAGRGHATAHDA